MYPAPRCHPASGGETEGAPASCPASSSATTSNTTPVNASCFGNMDASTTSAHHTSTAHIPAALLDAVDKWLPDGVCATTISPSTAACRVHAAVDSGGHVYGVDTHLHADRHFSIESLPSTPRDPPSTDSNDDHHGALQHQQSSQNQPQHPRRTG